MENAAATVPSASCKRARSGPWRTELNYNCYHVSSGAALAHAGELWVDDMNNDSFNTVIK